MCDVRKAIRLVHASFSDLRRRRVKNVDPDTLIAWEFMDDDRLIGFRLNLSRQLMAQEDEVVMKFIRGQASRVRRWQERFTLSTTKQRPFGTIQ